METVLSEVTAIFLLSGSCDDHLITLFFVSGPTGKERSDYHDCGYN